MNVTPLIFVIVLILMSCKSTYSQDNAEVEHIFNENFKILSSVLKKENKNFTLTNDQAAFLYLINSWVKGNVMVDFSGYPRFTETDLFRWKKWYKKNSNNINPHEFHRVLELYNQFFESGILSEEELKYLEYTSSKYNALD
jgi:hypothetical protein